MQKPPVYRRRRHAEALKARSLNAVRHFFVRAHPQSAKARRDRVFHNAQCPKLAQRNLKPDAYVRVEQPPDGYRRCRTCGG